MENAKNVKPMETKSAKRPYQAPKLVLVGNLHEVLGKSGATFEFGGDKRPG